MARRSQKMSASRIMIFYWLPVLVYLGIIYTLSAQPNLQPPIQFTMSDKFYHFLEYGLLGLLLARAVGAMMPSAKPMIIGLTALALGIMVGTSDEIFQSTVPGRDSSAFDLMADTTGLTMAQFIYRLFVRS